MRAHASRRRGGAALVALACLSVIALVVAGLLRVVADRADGLRRAERQAQAAWLVESGLERAAAHLRADPSYAGESWSIAAESLGGRPATVVIEVEPLRDDPDGPRTVRVRVDYPAEGDPADRVRRGAVFSVRPPAGRGGGDS